MTTLNSALFRVGVLLEGVLVHLLGAGHALPSTSISDDFLMEILPLVGGEKAQSPKVAARIKNRRSALPLEYLTETKNNDVLEARRVTLSSPTALAVRAIEEALVRASISKEQIGMIVADCATPFQTCPSEAQRIGGALGIKIPAFDVVGGAAAFSLYLDLLASWDDSKLPEYVVWVSTNTPTLHVNYAVNSASPFLFGDGAAALVVSTKVAGSVSIASSQLHRTVEVGPISTIERHIVFHDGAIPPEGAVSSHVLSAISRAHTLRTTPTSKLYVIGPQIGGDEVVSSCGSAGLENVVPLSSYCEHGYSLGSSGMIELASVWDTLRPGDVVSVSHLGDRLIGSCEIVVSE